MLEYYFVALRSLGQTPDLAYSALLDAPVRPERPDRRRPGKGRKPAPPPPNLSQALAPDATLVAAGPNESTAWDPCPCRQWGAARDDRHGCVAMCKELFPQLDQELDAWEAEHGRLYR